MITIIRDTFAKCLKGKTRKLVSTREPQKEMKEKMQDERDFFWEMRG